MKWMTITLPRSATLGPVSVMPSDDSNRKVFDADGRPLASLNPNEGASFELRSPGWWKFWQAPRWHLIAKF